MNLEEMITRYRNTAVKVLVFMDVPKGTDYMTLREYLEMREQE